MSSFNDAVLQCLSFGDVTEQYFKGALDEPVHAWLLRPAGFQPDRRYPLAVIIHGGPQVGRSLCF